jgi:hypothetical protein
MGKWIIDVSKHNLLTDEQWAYMVEHGLAGVIVRDGGADVDPRCALHVAACQKFSIPYGLYHWADPTVSYQSQIERIRNYIEIYKPTLMAIDLEHWWADWGAWQQVYVYKRNDVVIPVIPSSTLDRFYSNMLSLTRVIADAAGIELVGYSAKWFIDAYCRPLASKMEQYCDANWMAFYPKWIDPNQDKVCSWEEFYDFANNLPAVALPAGMTRCDIHQFAIGLPIKGLPALDMDWMSDEIYERLYGDYEVPTPESHPDVPETEPSGNLFRWEVMVDTLNIRSSPKVLSTTDIGDAHKGDLFEMADVEGTDAWLKTPDGKYVCITKSGKRYLNPKVD